MCVCVWLMTSCAFKQKLPVDVSVKLVMESVREIGIDATIDFYVEYKWRDERETKDVYISGPDTREYAWTPDVYFLLSRHTEYSKTSQYMIIANRTVLFDQKVTVTIPCVPNAFMYPFDTMSCNIVLSSYGFPKEKVNLFWARMGKPIDFPQEYHDIEYTGFVMLANHTTFTAYDTYYNPSYYTILEGQVYFKRLYAVYIYQLFLPAAFLVGLSWITFWINPNATPARAAIGVTTILTMLTLNTNRQQDRNAKYLNIKMSLLDIYLWTCFIYVIVAMVVFSASDYTLASRSSSSPSSLSPHTHHSFSPSSHPSSLIYKNGALCPSVVGSAGGVHLGVGVGVGGATGVGVSMNKYENYGMGVLKKVVHGRSIDFFARLLFPLTFLLFNCAFWSYISALS